MKTTAPASHHLLSQYLKDSSHDVCVWRYYVCSYVYMCVCHSVCVTVCKSVCLREREREREREGERERVQS
jgi:hypothetical protein